MSREDIIFLTIWVFIGLLSTIFMWIYDMRNKPYNERYFDGDFIVNIGFIFSGVITLALVLFIVIAKKYEKRKSKSNRIFTKFIYKIANIGIKKDGDKK